jgi:hypothetical protein
MIRSLDLPRSERFSHGDGSPNAEAYLLTPDDQRQVCLVPLSL